MAFSESAEKPTLKLIDADRSPKEFFALPNMHGDSMPASSLMLGEILKGVTPISWDIFNIRDFIRGVVPERFRVAPAVICLTRVAACGRLVPAKYLIVVFCMAVANFGIILGAPDVMLDAEVLLSKLVNQASKGPKQTLFHAGS